jgi:hypothetical protein
MGWTGSWREDPTVNIIAEGNDDNAKKDCQDSDNTNNGF